MTRHVPTYSLLHELLDTEIDVQRDFRVHVAPAEVAATNHEVEEPANAGPDQWHGRQRAAAVRISLTVSAYLSHCAVWARRCERPAVVIR